MDENFLLSTETAQKLYHEYAAAMPVLDYHCHISPQEIAEDKQFENIVIYRYKYPTLPALFPHSAPRHIRNTSAVPDP